MAQITVVEDNPHLRNMLKTMLSLRGHEVSVYPDGAEALLGIPNAFPDLVISDVQMPKMDGISLCKALRESYSKAQLPIILVSVLDAEEDILRALEAGANDYLVKPFSIALVKAKVSYHLVKEDVSDSPPTPEQPIALDTRPREFPYPYDKYDLLKMLAEGSYGAVYLARRRADGLQVALKVLERTINANREMLARYFREVAVLSELASPYVVKFLDSGYEKGHYFLTMDLIPGQSAYDLLYEEGVFKMKRALTMGYQMCNALGAIEAKGLVHRDVKPANVMMGLDGNCVLVDFGLAKARRDHSLTGSREFMGTAEYIAPEVIAGERESIATDLYSLGVSLYEVVVGTRPFYGETTHELLSRIASFEPAVPVNLKREDVPAKVSDLIARLMEPEPGNRLRESDKAEREFQKLLAELR